MKNKLTVKLLCLLLSLALLLPVLATTVLAASAGENGETEREVTDASIEIAAALDESHKVFEATYTDEVNEQGLTEWGYCGFEVKLTTYVKDKDLDAVPNQGILIVYVINTNTERVGTDSDVSIIESLLARGYVVVVADYQNDERAVSPALDWSLQTIRRLLLEDEAMTTYLAESVLPLHKEQSYALPAGYNIEFGVEYFNYAENAVIGTLERIVDIWNGDWGNTSAQDFLSDNGKKVIPWGQKTLEDGTLVYNDENGVRCVKNGDGYQYVEAKNGATVGDAVANTAAVVPEYKKIREGASYADAEAKTIAIQYTLAEDWWDCVKTDGTPIDVVLRMDILYPTNPEREVPVMGLSSSYETRSGDWLNAIRPHMTGFLFAGYAGAMWDHAYTPMARDDHYGYFQGDGAERNSFTLMGLTGIHAQTAAVRRLRYLADTEGDKYRFDVDRFGVYGHSKGCYVYVLGHPDPLSLEEQDLIAGNPDYEVIGENPWSTYSDGTEIPSNVQMVYGSSGSGNLWGTEGYAPMFISQGVNDGALTASSAYHNYSTIAYQYDIPALDFTMPGVGHTIIYGYSEEFDTDMYHSFLKFAHYWLNGAKADVSYITPIKGSTGVGTTDPITVKFTGPIPEDEIGKVTVTNLYNGEVATGSWESAFGNTTWIFTPDSLDGGALYYVNVPEDMKAENGKSMARSFGVTFRTTYESTVGAALDGAAVEKTESTDNGVFVRFDEVDFSLSTTTSLRIRVGGDAFNRIAVYAVENYDEQNPSASTIGALLDTVSVCGKGSYDADISAYADAVGIAAPVFYLKAEKTSGTKVLQNYDTDNNSYFGGDKVGNWIESDNKSVKISAASSYLYNLVQSAAYTEQDLGREITVSFRAYPTHKGNIAFMPMTAGELVAKPMNDAARYFEFETDENGEVIQKWYEFSFTYVVDEIDVWHDKHGYYLEKLCNGEVYIDDIVITERATGAQILGVEAVLHNANRYEESPDEAMTVIGGVDNVISGEGELYISGKDRDHTLGEQSKVYASLSLADFVNEEKVYLKLNVKQDKSARILVWGIADATLAQSFDKENVSYLNAPALDRFSAGMMADGVFGGKELSTVTVNGSGQYLADVTEYVRYMRALGAMYATVVLTLDGASEDKTLTVEIPTTSANAVPSEGFEDSEPGANPLGTVTNGKSGAAGGPAVTENEAYLGKKSLSFLVDESYTRVFLSKSLTPQNYTAADLGRSFTVSFYIKADVSSAVYLGLASFRGENNDWNGGSAAKLHQEISVTPTTEWQKVSFIFTVDEVMIKETYAVEGGTDGTDLAPTALTFNGRNGTDKYLFIDELTVTENTSSDLLSPKDIDFEDGTLGDGYGTYRNGSGVNPAIVNTEAHGGTKSLSWGSAASTSRWFLVGLVPSDFEDDDLGRIFEITLWVKTDLAGTNLYFGLASANGTNNDYNGGNTAKLHQEISIRATNEWQKVTLRYTVDEIMLKSTYVDASGTDGTGWAPATPTFNGAGNDTKTVYIDDVSVREIDPNAPTGYSYQESFEEMDTLTGITVNGLSGWKEKVTLSTTENHTPGKSSTKSMSFMSDGSSTRLYFGKLINASNTLTAADVGASYTVSFWIKPVESGSFRVMLGASGEAPGNGTLNDTTFTMAAADVGKWVRYEYSFTVTEEMVEGNDAFIIMRLSNNKLYFDDLVSVRYEKGTSISLGSQNGAAVSNQGTSEQLTLKNLCSDAGIKVSYLTYAAREYDTLQRVRLCLKLNAFAGQTVKLYGLSDAALPEALALENAPALNEDGTVNTAAVYGGAPVAVFTATEENITLDVTDYARAASGSTLTFLLVTETVGDTVHTSLDFSTFPFTKGLDYLADAEAVISDGTMSTSTDQITLLNVFGNDAACIETGKTYRLSVVAPKQYAAAFVTADGAQKSPLTYVGEADGAYIYTFTASADAPLSALLLEGEGITLDALTLISSATVALDGSPVLVYDEVRYEGEAQLQVNMTLHSSIDFNVYVPAYDKLTEINGKDKSAYPTVEIEGESYHKVSYRNLSANGIALEEAIALTVAVDESTEVEFVREVSIGKYAERVLMGDCSAELRTLILATADYLNEASRTFESKESEKINRLLDRTDYVRPEWTADGKDIVTIPSGLTNILGATVSINNTPGFAVFFRNDYEGEVTVMGKTFTKDAFHDGKIGDTACKFVYVSVAAYTMLDTFSVTVGEDTISYNLDTYVYRMTAAREISGALYAYAAAARAYRDALAK